MNVGAEGGTITEGGVLKLLKAGVGVGTFAGKVDLMLPAGAVTDAGAVDFELNTGGAETDAEDIGGAGGAGGGGGLLAFALNLGALWMSRTPVVFELFTCLGPKLEPG